MIIFLCFDMLLMWSFLPPSSAASTFQNVWTEEKQNKRIKKQGPEVSFTI